ncbi:ATP-dependent RNA helicase HrpA [Thalassotalea agarivorans]|uniref:ATP-dependent RNA helicase HrpA n=1 Tax=Thalassotalea agarivorans TaxID=349064 RepID=UPI000B8297AF
MPDALNERLQQVKLSDKGRFIARLKGLAKIKDEHKQQKARATIEQAIEESIAQKQAKLSNPPRIIYPDGLPVSERVEDIKKAIESHQVTIIAGETGSGKTTQIPKICMELGRGVDGLIGHTQPRRIAARTVANRIAEELQSTLGDIVGYKVRFSDHVSDNSYVKLMTDGILLAEMQTDRLLRQYDTIIIDEAHERSLNIDFILGYIKQILPKRPDLKVIITSATIDPERFSKHFNDAPIVEVSGRTYPVEVRYRPLSSEESDVDVIEGIIGAVEELSELGLGDILIFLNGEREIRDTAHALEREQFKSTTILPLYARLSVEEQNRIFKPHAGRNIVLATNVAETSLTVPGIKYVIDPGTARISRYSSRTKVQRLPIEKVSQASANQRAGRCGRVSAGVCIRLYDEDDFNSRSEFTDPEILRTNLATVILQMLTLGLGEIEKFPFVQPPENRNISDGVRLLEELDAVKKGGQKVSLTKDGQTLAKFPIDPRLAKMMLTAIKLGCSEQVAIVVSALSIQDPRERPHEKRTNADQHHARFKDETSDFLSLIKLWMYIQEQQKALSNNQFRKLCQKEFLSYLRIREWQDIFSQLRLTLREVKASLDSVDVEQQSGADLVHQSILSGLLSHLGQLDDKREYKGARNSKFVIFPGSSLAKKSPKWLMAAELVETSRLFARMVAKIDANWIEPYAKHLLKYSYSEPHWSKKKGVAVAYEQITLYGLVIVAKRPVIYKQIDPEASRHLFIMDGLVRAQVNLQESFYQKNQALVKDIEENEQKARRKDFLAEEDVQFDFYDQHIPTSVVCLKSFLAWWKKAKHKTPNLLSFTRELLLKDDAKALSANAYPTTWQQGAMALPLSYKFEPGEPDDGVSVHIPIALLNQIQPEGFDWLVPALYEELTVSLIKGLPKHVRKNFVPAPNYASAALANMSPDQGDIKDALAKQLLRMSGMRIERSLFDAIALPDHLNMNFKVFNERNKLLKQGRDLIALKTELKGAVKHTIKQVAEKGIEKTEITQWDFDAIPEQYSKKIANIEMQAFPALVDKKTTVAIELFEQQAIADNAMKLGVARLILLNIPSPVKYLHEKLPNRTKLGMYFNPFGSIQELISDCIEAACLYLVEQAPELPRDEQNFVALKEHVRGEIADIVLDGAIKVEQILSLSHDIRKKLKGKAQLNMIQSQGDIKQNVESLVYKGFVTKAGYKRLDDIIRYLNATLRRFEKLPIDPNQDRLKLLEIDKVTEQFNDVVGKQRKDLPLDNALADTFWMIQELRVSLFAQNLKTAYPISTKRILNHLKSFS